MKKKGENIKLAIHGVPRSGTTWLGEIFNSNESVVYKYQPLFSYAFKNRLNDHSSAKDIDSFFNELALTTDDFLDQTIRRRSGAAPKFSKSRPRFVVYKEVRYHHILRNMLEKTSDLKVVGLIRNPLSVIYSWLHAPKEFRKDLDWEELEEWRFARKKNRGMEEEFNGFEKWKEVAYLFEELALQYPDRFYLLNYKNLLDNTVFKVKSLFEFCDIQYTIQTDNFILKSAVTDRAGDAYSVFRKSQSDRKWADRLNPSIIHAVHEDLKDSILKKYLA